MSGLLFLTADDFSVIKNDDPSKNDIMINNIDNFLADQTHTFINGQFELSFMSSRWILKQLKRNPEIKTYEQLIEFNNKHNKRNSYG